MEGNCFSYHRGNLGTGSSSIENILICYGLCMCTGVGNFVMLGRKGHLSSEQS